MNIITQTTGLPALGATPGKPGIERGSGDHAHPAAVANGPTTPVDVEATLSSQATPQTVAGVDASKVARLRNAIAQGTYRVDAQRAAHNLLAMEHALGQP